jgi:hypothetical protein
MIIVPPLQILAPSATWGEPVGGVRSALVSKAALRTFRDNSAPSPLEAPVTKAVWGASPLRAEPFAWPFSPLRAAVTDITGAHFYLCLLLIHPLDGIEGRHRIHILGLRNGDAVLRLITHERPSGQATGQTAAPALAAWHSEKCYSVHAWGASLHELE